MGRKVNSNDLSVRNPVEQEQGEEKVRARQLVELPEPPALLRQERRDQTAAGKRRDGQHVIESHGQIHGENHHEHPGVDGEGVEKPDDTRGHVSHEEVGEGPGTAGEHKIPGRMLKPAWIHIDPFRPSHAPYEEGQGSQGIEMQEGIEVEAVFGTGSSISEEGRHVGLSLGVDKNGNEHGNAKGDQIVEGNTSGINEEGNREQITRWHGKLYRFAVERRGQEGSFLPSLMLADARVLPEQIKPWPAQLQVSLLPRWVFW